MTDVNKSKRDELLLQISKLEKEIAQVGEDTPVDKIEFLYKEYNRLKAEIKKIETSNSDITENKVDVDSSFHEGGNLSDGRAFGDDFDKNVEQHKSNNHENLQKFISIKEELDYYRDKYVDEKILVLKSLRDLRDVLPDGSLKDLGKVKEEFEKVSKKYIDARNKYINFHIEEIYGNELLEEDRVILELFEIYKEFTIFDRDFIGKLAKSRDFPIEILYDKLFVKLKDSVYNYLKNKEQESEALHSLSVEENKVKESIVIDKINNSTLKESKESKDDSAFGNVDKINDSVKQENTEILTENDSLKNMDNELEDNIESNLDNNDLSDEIEILKDVARDFKIRNEKFDLQIIDKKEYSREEAIKIGLKNLFTSNIKNAFIKHKDNDTIRVNSIKDKLIKFCGEQNFDLKANLLKQKNKLRDIFLEEGLVFPEVSSVDSVYGIDYPKLSFTYFYQRYLKLNGFALVERRIKDINQTNKVIFYLYLISSQRKERLFSDKIYNLKLPFLRDFDLYELDELRARYVDALDLEDDVSNQTSKFEILSLGEVLGRDIIIYSKNIQKYLIENNLSISLTEYRDNVVVPSQKAFLIAGQLGIDRIFAEALGIGFSMESISNNSFQDFINDKISKSMHRPELISVYLCLKGSLERLEKDKKTDPIQVFNMLNHEKKDYEIIISKFKYRYWEIYNELFVNRNNKDMLMEIILSLQIRGLEQDIDRISDYLKGELD